MYTTLQNSNQKYHLTTGQDWSFLVIDLMPPNAYDAPDQYQPT